MNRTKIEWTDYSWNPVVGCKTNCWYCYGKRIAKRFFKDNPNYEPKFYPERLKEPYKIKKPSKIFVCSMADLFGEWIPREWIEQIGEVCERNPQHIFMFLTQNPQRYHYFKFPLNCWLGTTATNGMDSQRLNFLRWEKALKGNTIFVSVEPLLGKFDKGDFNYFDLVIVGAMTGMGKKNVIPKKEWIESIKHPNIFYKENIKKLKCLKLD